MTLDETQAVTALSKIILHKLSIAQAYSGEDQQKLIDQVRSLRKTRESLEYLFSGFSPPGYSDIEGENVEAYLRDIKGR